MGLVGRYLAGGSPFDDRWFTTGNVVYMDGAAVSAEGALKIATVWRAINVMAAAVAVLPIEVYRRDGDTGRKPALDEPFRTKLRLMPNAYQTSYRWRHHLVGHLMLGGNYYAHKFGWDIPSQQQLRPLDPVRMAQRPEINPDGTLTYTYLLPSGQPRALEQGEVFHARGFSRDGVTGVSVIECMRETVALATANRTSRAAFMKNAMRPAVVVKFPAGKEVGETTERNVQQGYIRSFGGPSKAGLPLVIGDGADIVAFGINSKDAQFIESENFLVEEFLRYTGVPGVLCGYADKTATHASAESFFQSFVEHCVWPLTSNLEQELTTSLWGVQEEIFVKFNLSALLRADSTARAAFYRALVEMGIFTRNEVRELEDRNPLPGLDEPLTPKNMGGATPDGSAAVPPPQPAPPQPPDDGNADGSEAPAGAASPRSPRPPRADEEARAAARAERAIDVGLKIGLAAVHRANHYEDRTLALSESGASRIVQKETAAILGDGQKLGEAARYAKDPARWRAWLDEFYAPGGRHAALVMKTLMVSAGEADRYCAEQRDAILAGGVAVIGTWEATRVPHLVELAMGRF